jgi:hypothetical protein
MGVSGVFVPPARQTGKTSLWGYPSFQAIGRGIRPYQFFTESIEYHGVVEGHLLKQLCYHFDGHLVTNPKVLSLIKHWTFDLLRDHPGLRQQLATLITFDESIAALRMELWRNKNWSNRNQQDLQWRTAMANLRQAQEDYEIIRRLTDPECPYLVYKPVH